MTNHSSASNGVLSLKVAQCMPLWTWNCWSLRTPATQFQWFHLHSLCGTTLLCCHH